MTLRNCSPGLGSCTWTSCPSDLRRGLASPGLRRDFTAGAPVASCGSSEFCPSRGILNPACKDKPFYISLVTARKGSGGKSPAHGAAPSGPHALQSRLRHRLGAPRGPWPHVSLPPCWPPGLLPLSLDFVPQDKIGDEAQGDEENPEDHEVQVQLGVLHVQLAQDGL